MAFERCKKHASRIGGGRCEASGVMLASDKSGNVGSRKRTLRVRLGEEVCKEMRWVIGDRLDVLMDKEAKLVRIERVPSSEHRGWKLLPTATNKRKNFTGKIVTAYFKGTIEDEFMTLIFGSHDTGKSMQFDWTSVDGGVIVELPA